MTYPDWKAQLVPSLLRAEDGTVDAYRLYDPSTQNNVSLPVRSGAHLAHVKGWLPRWFYRHTREAVH